MQIGNSTEVAWKMSENQSFPASLLCAKNTKTYACPLFFAFFLVEKLVPVRLLPTERATSLVVVYILPFLRKVRKETSVCLPITKTN